jgi:hypothetical protein
MYPKRISPWGLNQDILEAMGMEAMVLCLTMHLPGKAQWENFPMIVS